MVYLLRILLRFAILCPLGTEAQQSRSELRQEPCRHNRRGSDSVHEGNFNFEGTFRAIHREVFERNGYVIVRNLISENDIRKFRNAYFGNDKLKRFGVPMCRKGCNGQPRRLKMQVHEKIQTHALRILNPALFMAFNFLVGNNGSIMNRTVNYEHKLRSIQKNIHTHNNVALPGSVFQNPHWDVPNTLPTSRGMVLIDMPLIDVNYETAPLEIWKGTHKIRYQDAFSNPTDIVQESNTNRQYWHCWDEILEAASKYPSAVVQSKIGDVVLRNPSTWHRGSPNNESIARDMITMLIQPRH